MPQRTLMKDVNTNWVSANERWKSFNHHDHLHNDSTLCSELAATRLQAKYKGYKAKGEFRKQKEAGECHYT